MAGKAVLLEEVTLLGGGGLFIGLISRFSRPARPEHEFAMLGMFLHIFLLLFVDPFQLGLQLR